MDPKRIPLSFEKFQSLIKKHKYEINHLFVYHNELRFAKIRSPRYGKIFFIYVPIKFFVKISASDTFVRPYTSTKIYDDPTFQNKNQQAYFELFKKGIDFSILCVSSKNILFFDIVKGLTENYVFEDKSPAVEEKPVKTIDKIKSLEEDFKKVKTKVIEDDEIEFVERTPPATDEKVDIVFEDEDGNEIEQGGDIEKLMIFPSTKINITKDKIVTLTRPSNVIPSALDPEPEESAGDKPKSEHASESEEDEHASEDSESEHASDESESDELEDIESVITEESEEDEIQKGKLRVNDLPDTLLQESIEVGNVYLVFDLTNIFKYLNSPVTKITSASGESQDVSFENMLIDKYAALDYNEISAREEKMREIHRLMDEFKISTFDKLYKMQEKEEEIRGNLARLSNVLMSCENLYAKSASKKKSFLTGNMSPLRDLTEIENIERQTKRTMDELTIELLKSRDKTSALLLRGEMFLDFFVQHL